MNRKAIFVLCLTSSFFAGLDLSAQQPLPAQLSITVGSEQVRKGSPINLQMTLTNISDAPLEIHTASGKPDGGHAEDYSEIHVDNSAGVALRRMDGYQVERSYGSQVRMPHAVISRRPVVLAPSDSFHDFAVLTRLFDLNEPGTYTIYVVEEVRLDRSSPQPQRIAIRSNTIHITVTD
jgi:hypothetical protein